MSKLKEKLESLYRLAKLTDDEIKLLDANKLDDGRLNEVRTASFLLLHTARTKGVRIKFIFDDVKSAPSRPDDVDFYAGFDFFLDEIQRKAREAAAKDAKRREELERQQREAREKSERDRQRERGPFPRERTDSIGAPSSPSYFKVDDYFQRPQSQPSEKSRVNAATPLIQSQYVGVCLTCGKGYKKGEQVWWIRSVGCSHFECGADDLRNVASGG